MLAKGASDLKQADRIQIKQLINCVIYYIMIICGEYKHLYSLAAAYLLIEV